MRRTARCSRSPAVTAGVPAAETGGGPGALGSSITVSAIDEPHDAAEPGEIAEVEVEASAPDIGRYLGGV